MVLARDGLLVGGHQLLAALQLLLSLAQEVGVAEEGREEGMRVNTHVHVRVCTGDFKLQVMNCTYCCNAHAHTYMYTCIVCDTWFYKHPIPLSLFVKFSSLPVQQA